MSSTAFGQCIRCRGAVLVDERICPDCLARVQRERQASQEERAWERIMEPRTG